MPYDPARHHRRSIRLPGYDYARLGRYFVTLCTHGRTCLFGEVEGERMRLNAPGWIADEEWRRTPEVRPSVVPDVFVVMPNHVHLLFGLTGHGSVGATRRVAPTTPGPGPGTVGAIMSQYRSLMTKRINALRGTPGAPVWQRNYYDRVVRDDREAANVRRYIAENPRRWHLDRYHPDRSEFR